MKQFNLDEYLRLKESGKEPKLITRDERIARIICTDRKSSFSYETVVALIETEYKEMVYAYNDKGRYLSDHPSDKDLFFADIEEELKYRPYKNADEFLKAQKEHGMYVYFSNCAYKLVTGVNRGSVAILWDSKVVEEINYEDLFRRATWQDGSPCGVKED